MNRPLAIAATTFLLLTVCARADTLRTFHVGVWSGGAYSYDGTRTFSHCAAGTPYVSGIYMIFAVDRTYGWKLSFQNSAWNLPKGTKYNIAFSIDGTTPVFAKATAVSRHQVVVPLADNVELFSRFRRGYVLRVGAVNQVFNFNLGGTSALLPALLKCVQRETMAPTTASANPFAKKEQAKNVSREIERVEATVFLSNLLSSASIPGFTLASPEKAAEFKSDAVWTARGILGTVSILSSLDGISAQELQAFLIGRDAKNCTGAFLSGAIPDKSAFVRLFTSCQDQKSALTAYYLGIPRPKGGIYLLATMGAKGSAEDVPKKAESDIRRAAFTLH